jgi:prolipoprotein diacylglyceryl transferase
VFKIWQGGLASHGATIALLLAMYLFCKRRKQSFIEGCDRFSFSAALGSTLIRLGNLFNSEIVGKPTDGSWGFAFPKYDHNADPVPLRHPSQIYEVALGLTVMGALYLADKKLGKEKRPRGALIAVFFAVYFTGRFIVEFYKEKQSPFEANLPLTMGQLLSIAPAIAGFVGLYLALKKKIPAHWYVPGQQPPDQGGGSAPATPNKPADSDVDEVMAGR